MVLKSEQWLSVEVELVVVHAIGIGLLQKRWVCGGVGRAAVVEGGGGSGSGSGSGGEGNHLVAFSGGLNCLGFFEAFGGPTADGKAVALQNALHVVTAHVEVRHCV